MTRPEPRPTDRPLDDGRRAGTEPWCELNGVAFCHWDRWLLRLALDERNGLQGMRADFRARAKQRTGNRDAEAMVAQIDDLQARLTALAMTPADVLDHEERASEWLKKKAFKRVWHDAPHAKTKAMQEPPRVLLERRALRGHWPSFPVDPARYERLFEVPVRDAWRSQWSDTQFIAHDIEDVVERMRARLRCDYKLLALHRCALTAIVECMSNVDDSGADMADAYRTIEGQYVELVRTNLFDVVIRDVLELAIWEDYGLTESVGPFLAALPARVADVVTRELVTIMTELTTHELEYQLERARRLAKLVRP